MKKTTMLAMAIGLSVRLNAAPLMTDVATYEALVIDGASGVTLVTGGPWAWEDLSYQTMSASVAGSGRTIVIRCRNAAGETILGGAIAGADLTIPWSPFAPPIPSGEITLEFYTEANTVAVFLGNGSYIGTITLQPAQDDPDTPATQSVVIDIKPGSAANPFNMASKGVLPVALLGSSDLDVNRIDPASLRLAGVAPIRQSLGDTQNDGIADVLLHFRDEDIARLLPDATDGEVVGLELTGLLTDGTPIKGTDSITLLLKKRK